MPRRGLAGRRKTCRAQMSEEFVCDCVISGNQFACCDWRRRSRVLFRSEHKKDLGFRGGREFVGLAGGVD
jgi:hypothetical protein